MKEKIEEMAKIKEMERKMNVRFEEREFLWDPSACGGVDDFLAMVERSGGELDEELGGEREKRGCRKCENEEWGDAEVCRICGKENTAEGEGFRMLLWWVSVSHFTSVLFRSRGNIS